MNHLVRIACCLLLASALTPVKPAFSEDRGAWFKSLTQPKTGLSCCDIADCRRTEADWRGGQWWAKVEDKWTPIPPERELEAKSIDGEAYVCSGPQRFVYCFVRPNLAW